MTRRPVSSSAWRRRRTHTKGPPAHTIMNVTQYKKWPRFMLAMPKYRRAIARLEAMTRDVVRDHREHPSPEGEEMWSIYLRDWTRWNHLRTVCSLATASTCTMILALG